MTVGEFMAIDTRELFARLIQCEAGGEGEEGMRAVATVIMNRVNAQKGEFARVSNGGDLRAIIQQPDQFTCMKTYVNGEENFQNVYNMHPEQIHYDIADWALAGNRYEPVGDSLFFMNPCASECPICFPTTEIGIIYNRIGQHCFYTPRPAYDET